MHKIRRNLQAVFKREALFAPIFRGLEHDPKERGGKSMKYMSMAVAGLAALLVLATSHVVFADSDRQTAIKAGATQLTSEEIEALLVGNTVKAKSGQKVFFFHYSKTNVLSGKLDGGGWSDTGYYGITDDDRVCLSMTKDKGRLRCLTLMKLEGEVKKYNVDGKMTFELLEFQSGNHL